MSIRFQRAKADGNPDWSPGQEHWLPVWEAGRDYMRFHRGEGWELQIRPNDPKPQKYGFDQLKDRIKSALDHNPVDTVVEVRSLVDNYTLLWRRHEVPDPKGELVIAHAKAVIGTSYVFGVTDCSWLTMHCYGLEGIELPHNAHLQHLENQVLKIQRSQLKSGDLLFHHNDDHVSLYLDNKGPGGTGRVIDTEPHDTGAPSGWPTSRLGVGVQVRPMISGYYCDFEHVNGYGRIVAINGKP